MPLLDDVLVSLNGVSVALEGGKVVSWWWCGRSRVVHSTVRQRFVSPLLGSYQCVDDTLRVSTVGATTCLAALAADEQQAAIRSTAGKVEAGLPRSGARCAPGAAAAAACVTSLSVHGMPSPLPEHCFCFRRATCNHLAVTGRVYAVQQLQRCDSQQRCCGNASRHHQICAPLSTASSVRAVLLLHRHPVVPVVTHHTACRHCAAAALAIKQALAPTLAGAVRRREKGGLRPRHSQIGTDATTGNTINHHAAAQPAA